MIVGASNWHSFSQASETVRTCYNEQIRPPELGNSRIVIGWLDIGIIMFWFENHGETPEHYMIIAYP